MKIQIKGNSGCKIDIIEEECGICVYKSTEDSKYVSRLVTQAHKQEAFDETDYKNFRVPKIYSIKKASKEAIIKMQYIHSMNFIEFFNQAGYDQVNDFICSTKGLIEQEIAKCEINEIPTKVLLDKLTEIKEICSSNSLFKNNPIISDIFKRSEHIINAQHSLWIPIGACHGDLTFSNILFNGTKYYLIDFLDSFIETPLQDIIKIRQDTLYQWSLHMYTKQYDKIRFNIIFNKIDREIHLYFSGKYKWYRDYYHVMQLMNILRILPYSREEKMVYYLQETLYSIINGFETNCHSSDYTAKASYKIQGINPAPQNLILPIAENRIEYKNQTPQTFLYDKDGVMNCFHAIKGLDITKFNRIYITILKEHDKKFSLTDKIKLQLTLNNINNAEIVVLDEPTSSQPETIYKTILKKNIKGSIFIKDADCSFIADIPLSNAVAIYSLEQLRLASPQNKSYVCIDSMQYITNIIEKNMVSRNFTAGGYSFANADTFCRYYLTLQNQQGLYLSHIIYSMILEGYTFRPIHTKDYEDFGVQTQ